MTSFFTAVGVGATAGACCGVLWFLLEPDDRHWIECLHDDVRLTPWRYAPWWTLDARMRWHRAFGCHPKATR